MKRNHKKHQIDIPYDNFFDPDDALEIFALLIVGIMLGPGPSVLIFGAKKIVQTFYLKL